MIQVFSVAVPARMLFFFMAEAVLVFCAYVFAAWADSDLGDLDSFLRTDSGLLRILLLDATILLGLYLRNLYSQFRLRDRIALLQELSMIFGVAFVMQGLINYVNHDLTVPRKVMIVGSGLALVSIFCARLVLSATAGSRVTTGQLLFLGMSPAITRVAGYLTLHPEMGLAPAGYLELVDAGSTAFSNAAVEATSAAGSLPRLGTLADLDAAIETCQPVSIVIGKPEMIRPWWTDEFLELHFGGIRTEEAATLYEKAFGRVCAAEVRPRDLVFADTFEPSPLVVRTQTFYSTLLALAATLIMLPVMALIAMYLRFSSSAPALLSEQRVGLHGVPFAMYSFQSQASFLQRSGLLALPRLFNVLAGQMALTGPHPERPEFAARLAEEIPFYTQRHRVKPGLTGWEQIHRHALHPHDGVSALEYDLYYIRHLAPSLDSAVLLLCLKKWLVGDLAAI